MVISTNISNQRLINYVEKKAKDQFITKSKVVANLISKDYYLNHTTIESGGLPYEVDLTNNTMTIELPQPLIDALHLTENLIKVNLK